MKTTITKYKWFALVIATLSSAACAQTRPADFGHRWVRSHPFTLMALTQRGEVIEQNKLYSQAGLNTMLAWKDREGIFKGAARDRLPWQYHLDHRRGPLSDEVKAYVDGLLGRYPGGEGILLWDEPKGNEMAELGKVAAWLREAHPELLIYTNLNPIPPTGDPRFAAFRAGMPAEGNETYPYSYEDSIQDCVDLVKPDLLMTDIYPFWSPQTLDPKEYLQRKYFLNLSMIRDAARGANVPYWMFVQAYQDVGRVRLPSESDLRMQVFSTLAYGYTGIAYYTYDVVEEGSMLDADGKPTPMYERVKSVNAEVSKLGRSLRMLSSTDVLYVPGASDGGVNPTPLGLETYRAGSWNATAIQDIQIGSTGADANVLLGLFEDDAGGLYFMIVNLHHGENLSAEQAAMPVTVRLSPTIEKLFILSRKTGRPEPAPLKCGQIELNLPGGTAELFKLHDGAFAGLARGAAD